MNNNYELITLPNGVRIVKEPIGHLRSAAAGIWVANGSRYETPSESGISHFIEHMIFKGTKTRSAADIAAAMDAIGGQFNAFTTKECTSYYLRTLDEYLPGALELLCDMFFESRFAQADIETERGVIYEEIDMYEDTPDELANENLMASVFKDCALGRPILGTKETLAGMTGDALHSFVNTHYVPENIVVSLSGSVPDEALDYLKARFSKQTAAPRPGCEAAVFTPSLVVREKPIEQNHLCLGFKGLSYTDDRRYAAQIFSGILGGGMSSRLFQRVREQAGLCYSIYSFSSAHADTGVFGVYTALGRDTEERALRLIREEIERLVQDGPTPEELSRTRAQVKANILMSLESTVSRMNHIGRSALLLGRVSTPDEVIARYDAVDMAAVRAAGEALCDKDTLSLSAVGRVRDADAYREILHG